MRRWIRPFLFSAFNGLAMLALALFWISLPRTFGDEALFIKWTSLAKKTVFGIDPKPAPEDFLYVDVSRTKTTIPVKDALFEEYTEYGHIAITNRAHLASFLDAIHTFGQDVPLVLIDIYFGEPSPQDSLLQAAIDSFPFPIVGATDFQPESNTNTSSIKLSTGVAMYLSVDENFMKYPLYFDGERPTLPLAALQEAESVDLSAKGWWPRINGQRSLSNPIIDFKVRPFDFEERQLYHLHDMGSLLYQFEFWDTTDITALFSEKTIIIGDFHNDEHETVFGSMPGPMLVHNAYLTLKEGESLIRWQWILMLYLLFFWMSWRVYFLELKGKRSWLWRISQTSFGKIIADNIDDTFFLAMGTIASYFLFNVHINILVLLIFLKVVSYILRRFIFKKHLKAEEE